MQPASPRLGVAIAGDPWRFFDDLFADWQPRAQVSVFASRKTRLPFLQERLNRYLFRNDLGSFLQNQDLVFFEWASHLLAEATRLPKTTRIVTRLHRYEMFRWVDEIQWDKVDRVIFVSRWMQSLFVEKFPDQAAKTVVIPVGVDLDRFRPVARPFGGDLGTLCYLSPRKRVYELILAFSEMLAGAPGLRLHIGGGKKVEEYSLALESLVKKLDLQDQVIFHDDVREPWKWYSNIDIFISNSYSEGLQVAPMEAMASGRYTLSHHWDGAEELLPPENLFLSDSELQALVMAYAAAGESERRCRQERMRRLAEERFDLEQVKNRIWNVLMETLAS